MSHRRKPGFSMMFSKRIGRSLCAESAGMYSRLTGLVTRVTMSALLAR